MAKKVKKLTVNAIADQYKKVEIQRMVELKFLEKRIKLLRPQKGDILIVPSEAFFDFNLLNKLLLITPIKFALVVPKGNANLMQPIEALRFAKKILSKYDVKKTKASKATRTKTARKN
jgi:hypothetical protein